MTYTYLEISGLDPIVARDGRPFGDGTGNRMRGLPWPLPSAVAGSARRAILVGQPDRTFDEATIEELLQVEVAGLLPVADDRLFLPAPLNCVWSGDTKNGPGVVYRAIPQEPKDGEGSSLPDNLWPVLLDGAPDEDFKPKRTPAWWPVDYLAQWLCGKMATASPAPFENGHFLDQAMNSLRNRVAINPSSGSAEESKLFAVSDLYVDRLPIYKSPSAASRNPREQDAFWKRCRSVVLSTRVSNTFLTHPVQILHPLGGNKRLVAWRSAPTHQSLWSCPEIVQTALQGAQRVCMMLVTPGLFSNGSMPGWLQGGLGSPPDMNGVTLRLVGVLTDRWRALSRFSWDWRKGRHGPRPLRRMVPAGGIYYFKVESGEAAELCHRWLTSVCDDVQDRRDGFGIAVWGIW